MSSTVAVPSARQTHETDYDDLTSASDSDGEPQHETRLVMSRIPYMYRSNAPIMDLVYIDGLFLHLAVSKLVTVGPCVRQNPAAVMMCFACDTVKGRRSWLKCQWNQWKPLVCGADQWKRNCCKDCSDVSGWGYTSRVEVKLQRMSHEELRKAKAEDHDEGKIPPTASGPSPVAVKPTMPWPDMDSFKQYKVGLTTNLRALDSTLWLRFRYAFIEINLSHRQKLLEMNLRNTVSVRITFRQFQPAGVH